MKSHSTITPPERRHINIVQDRTNEKSGPVYKNFSELCKRVQNLKLKNDWEVFYRENKVLFKLLTPKHLIPHLEIVVNDSLEFTIIIFGWILPDDHLIYKKYMRSVRNITVSNLLHEIRSYELCPGLDNINSKKLIHHVVPVKIDFEKINLHPFQAQQFKRPKDCEVLHMSDGNCQSCINFTTEFNREITMRTKHMNTPAHPNAPLSKTHPNRVRQALIQEREKSKKQTKEIERMKHEIKNKGIELDSELHSDINHIMTENCDNMSEFMKLFWEEQRQASTHDAKGVRYHPMIIRFCLSLASKSASAYDELRDSRVLTLPSRRTLRDYKNAIRPVVGFNPEIIQDLINTTSKLEGYQRNVVISFDEIKIQENLVFNKHSGELIGYVDLGDPDLNYSTFKDVDALATHCLVYYIRGIASDLKFGLAYFATKGVTACQIMPTFWKAVSLLELVCKLHVIIAVSDGASPNRSFYRMHSDMDMLDNSDIVYRTVNIFAPRRFIYFVADAPHLMKTLRNCIYHSGDGKGTRSLWNNGQQIIWYHFHKLVNDEINSPLKLIPKLTLDHVNLTPYSVMNVRLATQILSKSVANVLYEYYPQEMHATAELCDFMDAFFDCLNVRNQVEGTKTRKEFLRPYRDIDDPRFNWLKKDFLNYLSQWKESINHREGNFTRNARDRMFISRQTYEGLQITVNSVVEATRFLLKEGMPFVLTERYNQDVLEEYFGRHRSLGRRNDNPTVHQFGYQSNTIRMQRSIAPVTGNTCGAHKQKRKISWQKVDNEPLKKRLTASNS